MPSRRHVIALLAVSALGVTVPLQAAAPAAALQVHRPSGQQLEGADAVTVGETRVGALPAPAVPPGLAIRDVVAGTKVMAALLSDGSVSVSSAPGSADTFAVPARLTGKTVTAVATGGSHLLAVTSDGSVTAWGEDVGTGDTTVPASLDGQVVTAVAAGSRTSYALTATGHVVAWGDDSRGETEAPAVLDDESVVALSAAFDHVLALTSDGDVVAWGSDGSGESDPPAGLADRSVVAVAAAGISSMALTADGHVVSWGSALPGASQAATLLADQDVVALSGGGGSALALTATGRLVTWGYGREDPAVVQDAVGDRRVTAFDTGSDGEALVAVRGRLQQADLVLDGSPLVGQTLTATGTATPTPTTSRVGWLRDGVPIAGARGRSYVVSHADVGHQLTASATLRKEGYEAVRVVSAPTSEVPAERMPGTATARVTGRLLTGARLTAHLVRHGMPSGSVAWRWKRDGKVVSRGPTRTLVAADYGHRVTAVATLSADGYVDRVVVSRTTATVRRRAATFTVRSSARTLHRGHHLTVRASHLAAGEDYTVTLGRLRLARGHADASGRLDRRLTVPRRAGLTSTALRVRGCQRDRAGSTTVRVRR